MPKGIFTASLVVLTRIPPAPDEVARVLGPSARPLPKSGASWMGGASLVVPLRPEVNGNVLVDIVEAPWPDSMGDPEGDPQLFAAWSVGAFGPFVFPGALERAVAHTAHCEAAGRLVEAHESFVRVRASYVLGAGESAPTQPEDYDAVAEIQSLTAVARGVLRLPGALAYFNPSGEVILDARGVDESLERHLSEGLPPFELWSNVRHFELGDAPGWSAMDTVGMEQVEVWDQEACFPVDVHDPGDVAAFLRNVSLYLLERGPIIQEGDSIDGPLGGWCASLKKESLAPAPRPTLRWTPEGARVPPALV